MIKNCLLCGDEFKAKEERNLYCKKSHYKECPVCKKDFLLVRNRDKLTCSPKCASDYRNENVRYDCICKVCGKAFKGKTKKSNTCEDPHYKKCIVCKKTFKIIDNHRPSLTCSSSCASSLSHTEEAKKNRKEKSLKKHGTEFPFQAKYVVKKIQESLNNSENDTRIGSKRWNRMLEEKYNVENISQVEDIKRKKEKTYYEKYGVKNPGEIQISNYEDWINFENFIKNKNFDCWELAKYFNVKMNTVRNKAKDLNVEYKIKDFYKYSNPELIVKHILHSLGILEKDMKPQYRRLISPLEVDFYIPTLNLAIEVSPTFTHNSKYGWNREERNATEPNYHKNKYLLCKEKGVRLVTLFEWITTEQTESILKEAIIQSSPNSKNEKIIAIDLAFENYKKYESVGYKKIKEVPPKVIYHNPQKNIVIKSNKTIRKHKVSLERNGFLPVYNCGYVILELA